MPLTDFLTCTVPESLAGRRPFIKMHGLRNHFVFIDQRRGAPALSPQEIVRICDVHEGVGAEQVIAIETPSPHGASRGAHVFMRILNIDGTEAEACGNATRCLASLLIEETGRDEVLIESLGGILHCRKAEGGLISVKLGPIVTDWRDVPLAFEMDAAHLPIENGPLKDGMALSIGNPHVVFFVADYSAIDIPRFAPGVAASHLLPHSANVGVAQVLDDRTLRMAVWERPGILTEACGTGACAAAYAGFERGYLKSDRVTVHLPGGTLQIELLPDRHVIKTGPVAICCLGYV
jgi:diaminopimelate epimerase